MEVIAASDCHFVMAFFSFINLDQVVLGNVIHTSLTDSAFKKTGVRPVCLLLIG